MALLKIYHYPEKVLLQKALPVETIDDSIIKLVNDMGETMFDAPGVGLAAPQVGESKRIIVYNPSPATSEEDEDLPQEFKALINPEIIASSGSITSEGEACLSVPDYSCDVKRFEKVTVRGLNLEGKKLEFDAEGILAVIMQHEIDHLDGVLYIDRISALKRNMYKKKLKKRLQSN
ncbi:MAG: peptide deformylase [Desulfobacteraceae bacterium]|nr:peptide deformylase [Desulfobacteraceae bacterium]